MAQILLFCFMSEVSFPFIPERHFHWIQNSGLTVLFLSTSDKCATFFFLLPWFLMRDYLSFKLFFLYRKGVISLVSNIFLSLMFRNLTMICLRVNFFRVYPVQSLCDLLNLLRCMSFVKFEFSVISLSTCSACPLSVLFLRL